MLEFAKTLKETWGGGAHEKWGKEVGWLSNPSVERPRSKGALLKGAGLEPERVSWWFATVGGPEPKVIRVHLGTTTGLGVCTRGP